MTSKDLVLVCLVSAVAGAGAAFAASVLHDSGPPAGISDELASRLDRIENSLARAAEGQKEAKESVSRLNERVTGLHMDVGAAREEAAKAAKAAAEAAESAETQALAPRALRPGALRIGEGGRMLVAGKDGTPVLLGEKEGTPELALDALRAQMPEISKRLAAVSEGLKLRMLPEEERWKKAQDELRLSDGQVQQLKEAIAERDRTMKEMMQVETTADEAGASKITIKRLDPAKAAQAQGDYQRKVASTLDSEQKKSWDEKGYDSAFGGPGGRGSIAVVQAVDMQVEESPPAK